MILKDLVEELEAIIKVHPDAENAIVWAGTYDNRGEVHFTISSVGYDDKHHKPARIWLKD